MAADSQGPICTCRSNEGRNLIICLDGTSNQFGEHNTNVIELYNRIEKGKKQRTYYNSGVGTFADSSWLSVASWAQAIDNKVDQAVAKNFDQIILGAYRWLSELYKGPKDKIYIFGFSRGAYQARCLAGMISKVGLLHRGNEEQIPFAYELYSKDSTLAETFKKTFSKDVGKIHFVGVWDTVSSVGVVRDKTLPFTTTNNHICFFRHALALDEQRVKFLPEYVKGHKSADEGTSAVSDPYNRPPPVKEVWFPGRHSDVGGGNSENLSSGRIALHWMAYEAVRCGLELNPVALKFDRYADFLDWKDIVKKANGFKDSSQLLEEWKDIIEPDPLSHFGSSTKAGPKHWECLPSLERRIAIYEAGVCYSSPLVRWQLCDPGHVEFGLSGKKLETQKVFLDAIVDCHEDSSNPPSLPRQELMVQAKLVGLAWEADDLIPTQPRIMGNFRSDDFDRLRRVIRDGTLSQGIRVVAARILSCTFATDLGRALMYLVRSPDFLVHLGDMHTHKQKWVQERALIFVLELFDYVPDVSLIRETQSERQSGDGPNDLKAWTASIAKQFGERMNENNKPEDKQPDHVVADQIMSKLLENGECYSSHAFICDMDIKATFSCPKTNCSAI
ncbi:hypothetical protein EST38_g1519 [Candolleomyces aberdarensis]|uniref:T6SS Phospholipase effector Tle1-like catalytic domain-containing protein n=1 Tax=Candolleomyces aberdarensis TaxID=2316362 RepID=A0A4Q2DV75_9AGAR|nr:hypothetical protein EST38_g1519 [Candolleomyces aberdarensis]